jgi:hypothetical protein
MKLIREYVESDIELVEDISPTGSKNYFINGIFMQSEAENKNRRIYPRHVLEKQVSTYQKTINEKRSIGELGHPDSPNLNLERASHLITSLKMEGTNVIGKAKILDTPYGKITKNLLDEGVKLGVSSRGLGSIQERGGKHYVGEDFNLTTVDIVHEPSAHEAFVEGIMEGANWVYSAQGWVPEYAERYAKPVIEQAIRARKDKEAEYAALFENFLKGITGVQIIEEPSKDQVVLNIAKSVLDFSTLTKSNNDDKDFKECSVWDVKKALEQAYDAGAKSK